MLIELKNSGRVSKVIADFPVKFRIPQMGPTQSSAHHRIHLICLSLALSPRLEVRQRLFTIMKNPLLSRHLNTID
ncbi:hypothetical protein T07_7012 [Trichinella nelsoni]|uniref:Uncharacterized protein n=1 Tax=Trichinella nelsoni TaxID=6336 RepID=A0A0V0RC12_9BILA|nr:hypothetical protein T07_7012 [Trichinella nelsoni]